MKQSQQKVVPKKQIFSGIYFSSIVVKGVRTKSAILQRSIKRTKIRKNRCMH